MQLGSLYHEVCKNEIADTSVPTIILWLYGRLSCDAHIAYHWLYCEGYQMQVAHGICCAAGRSLVANQLLLRCTEGCGSQHLLCSDGPAVVIVGGARTCAKPLFVSV